VKQVTDDTVQIRPYSAVDEDRVLDLLRLSLGAGPGGDRSREFFRWKHFDNPFGRSFILVAETDDTIVGLRAFMRWRFLSGPREFTAVRAVDTATHPHYQGRGIFARLTQTALQNLDGEIDFVFNTPNEKSLPGYLKMGWRTVGKVPVSIRIRRPVRFVRATLSRGKKAAPTGAPPKIEAEKAADALDDVPALSQLLEESVLSNYRLTTPRTVAYLEWRYAQAPLLDYRAVREFREGRLVGIALFRVRPRGATWETMVADLIVPQPDRKTARRLLRRVAQAAPVDHVTSHFPHGWAQAIAARQAGYVRMPVGLRLISKPLRENLNPDPSNPGSWALTLGDLEVF
jgi:GNAT superfamily N-acetyltransferase